MKSVLITGGGCEEAIDGVRSVTNFSTGKTSSALAEFFVREGWNVTLLAGKRAVVPSASPLITIIRFKGYSELKKILTETLERENFFAVIHAAAVSDFIVERVEADGKIFRSGEADKISSETGMTIVMKPTEKILPQIKRTGDGVFTVGYKLTNNASFDKRKEAVQKLFAAGGTDLVVSNDLSEIDDDFHRFSIYDNTLTEISSGKSKREMGEALLSLLEKKMEKKRENKIPHPYKPNEKKGVY